MYFADAAEADGVGTYRRASAAAFCCYAVFASRLTEIFGYVRVRTVRL